MASENAHIAKGQIVRRSRSFLDVSGRSIIRLSGRDAQDLLQRLSTNDISKLAVGGSVQTILTNEKGRIVDVLAVLRTDLESLLLIGQSKGGEELLMWLEKYIIMEEAVATNASNEYVHFLIFEDLSDGDHGVWMQIPYGKILGLEMADNKALSFAEKWNGTILNHLLAPLGSKESAEAFLQDRNCVGIDPDEFETYRVSHTIPSFPNELSSLYNPIEAGLMDFINFTKGCYIGQEVIARLDTYKKVQQKLVQLELGAQPKKLPEEIFSSKEMVGSITSVGVEESASKTMALGYVKTKVLDDLVSLFFLKDGEQIPVKQWT